MQALWMIYHDIGQMNCRLEVTYRDILNVTHSNHQIN